MTDLSQDSRRFSRHSKHSPSDYKPEPLLINPACLAISCIVQGVQERRWPIALSFGVCLLCMPCF
jgi:hypothetical protein